MIGWIGAGGVAAALLAIGYVVGRRRGRSARSPTPSSAPAPTSPIDDTLSLQRLGFGVSESLEIDQVAERSAMYLYRALEAEGALVALVGPQGPPLEIRAAAGSLAKAVGRTVREADHGALLEAIGTERVVKIDGHPSAPQALLPHVTVTRALVAPLNAHGETLGAIAVVPAEGRPFSTEAEQLITTLTTHAALILTNAKLLRLISTGKAQWESVFDALSEGIAVLDESGMIRRVNQSLAALVGLRPVNLVDRHLGDVLFGDRETWGELSAGLTQSDSHFSDTVRSRTLHRTLKITLSSIRARLAGSGTVAALVEDVTEWHAMEARVIQNERMVAVGQLVSGVAHELNNPLTSIAGLAEFLVMRSSIAGNDREHLNVIQEQAERANRIVANLLTFARRGPAETTEIDLSDLGRRAALLMGYEMRLHEIDLETDLAPDLPPARGDRYELQQVVVNLLTNAAQAVRSEDATAPAKITVSTGRDGEMVYLRVRDSGPGIRPENLHQIFTPFFTTKEPGAGTGLGLSIAFRIVEGHRGRLVVEDNGPGGACFRLDLPMDPSAPAAHATPSPERRIAGNVSSGRRIMVVDGDPAIRRMINALFSEDGQSVEAFSAGEPAVSSLESGEYDLIIADPRVAASAGETFAELLVRRWPHLRPQTILITADVRRETGKWLESLGCQVFPKPFNVKDFLRAAAVALRQPDPSATD